ncbi:hypothetical protein ACFVGM_04485 [Kitasatospora purpeofusca]|uniref:hypothetical protein n=1 Tax=Kitasatospora purpeofusca TaxID=67352 RepID=UPI003689930B
MNTSTFQPDDPNVTHLTRRLDRSVPDGDFAPTATVASLTRRLDHSVPDGDFAPVGTQV